MSEYKKITILVTKAQYKYLKESLIGTSKLVRFLLSRWIKEEGS